MKELSDSSIPPTVSVIIPLYNKGEYIQRALSSVLAQTYPPLEIIVVDDGSTDDGPEKVKEIEDPKIILVRQENKGPGAARNAGLAIARGKYISFLDADDEYLPSFLEVGISLLEDRKANITMVYTGFYYYRGMQTYTVGLEEKLSGVIEISTETDLRLVRQLCCHWTCAAIIKTDIVRKWGGFFDKYKCLYGEDVFLMIKLAFNERIGIIPEPHVIYHTEASDLYGGGTIKKYHPILPYLEYADEILNACPPAKLPILKRFLSQIALLRIESFAKLGRRMEAKRLLHSFNRDGYFSPKEALKARSLVTIAPALPVIRWLWRNTKSITRLNRIR